jgi:hypothetical protein
MEKMMRIMWCTAILSAVMVLFSTLSVVAQVNWSVQGIALPKGEPGDLDSAGVCNPWAIYDLELGLYRMWYHGQGSGCIFLAESEDGITWEKYHVEGTKPYPTPVLYPGSSGEWDDFYVAHPCVVKDLEEPDPEKRYKMWYSAHDGHYEIGYAYSRDGYTWEKYDRDDTPNHPFEESDPVIRGTTWIAIGGRVLIEDDIYKMWYTSERSGVSEEVFYAQSWDGVEWFRDPIPVLPRGEPGSWDRLSWINAVLPRATGYQMWYEGNASWGDPEGIGYAVSGDERGWRKYFRNPLAGLPENAREASVIEWVDIPAEGPVFKSYKMWYTLYQGGGPTDIYYATAPQEPVTVTFDWYQDNVPIGGKLEFGATYTNHSYETPARVEVSFSVFKNGIAMYVQSEILNFYPGNTTKVYTMSVPNKPNLVGQTFTIGLCVTDLVTGNEFWDTFDIEVTEGAETPPAR